MPPKATSEESIKFLMFERTPLNSHYCCCGYIKFFFICTWSNGSKYASYECRWLRKNSDVCSPWQRNSNERIARTGANQPNQFIGISYCYFDRNSICGERSSNDYRWASSAKLSKQNSNRCLYFKTPVFDFYTKVDLLQFIKNCAIMVLSGERKACTANRRKGS